LLRVDDDGVSQMAAINVGRLELKHAFEVALEPAAQSGDPQP
jgi:hypothetical protein